MSRGKRQESEISFSGNCNGCSSFQSHQTAHLVGQGGSFSWHTPAGAAAATTTTTIPTVWEPFSKFGRFSSSGEVPHFSCSPKVNFIAPSSPPLARIISQINPTKHSIITHNDPQEAKQALPQNRDCGCLIPVLRGVTGVGKWRNDKLYGLY